MVSAFFYCASPYVGYTLRKADYVNEEMKIVSEKDMTGIGHKLFNSSGSYTVLGSFSGKKYFHSRQSQSENFDEQGRRIYTNIAFVGENKKDDETINKIAMYVMFNEEKFYKQIADMISLLDDGFSVDFGKLKLFINSIENSDMKFEASSAEAQKFYDGVMKCNNKELSFVVTESTWSYFIKQAGYNFNDSVLYKLLLQDAQSIAQSGKVELNIIGGGPESETNDDEKDKETEALKQEINNICADRTRLESEIEVLKKKISELETNLNSLPVKGNKETEALKLEINNICAERNRLESEIDILNKKLSDLLEENGTLKNKLKRLALIGFFAGIAIGAILAVLIILIFK